MSFSHVGSKRVKPGKTQVRPRPAWGGGQRTREAESGVLNPGGHKHTCPWDQAGLRVPWAVWGRGWQPGCVPGAPAPSALCTPACQPGLPDLSALQNKPNSGCL